MNWYEREESRTVTVCHVTHSILAIALMWLLGGVPIMKAAE